MCLIYENISNIQHERYTYILTIHTFALQLQYCQKYHKIREIHTLKKLFIQLLVEPHVEQETKKWFDSLHRKFELKFLSVYFWKYFVVAMNTMFLSLNVLFTKDNIIFSTDCYCVFVVEMKFAIFLRSKILICFEIVGFGVLLVHLDIKSCFTCICVQMYVLY